MVNTSDTGTRTEAVILSALALQGYRVLVPFGGGHPYDLAVETDGEFLRIECKTGHLVKGCIVFNSCTYGRDKTPTSYRDRADYFAVWCPRLDKVYLVPVEDAGEVEGRLRVESTLNGQSKRVHWAKEYELERVAQLVAHLHDTETVGGSSPLMLTP